MLTLRDPVHGAIVLDPVEAALIDTAPMQRLRRIRQLGPTYLVFPGAEHSRFVHSVGACHVAGLLGETLRRDGWRGRPAMLRVAALLHDVGHPPFSHAGERGVAHERVSAAMIRGGEIAGVLRAWDIDPEEVIATFDAHHDPVAAAVVSGQLDADRMDYLLRDAHMCGVSHGVYDLPQLVANVACGEDGIVVRREGLHAAEGLLLARTRMFLEVYFHRTRRLLDLLLAEVLPDFPAEDDVAGWLAWDDARVLERLRDDPRPAARALRDRRALPVCVAAFEVSSDAEERTAAAELAHTLTEELGAPPRVDSSATLRAFRPDGDIPVRDPGGRVRSIFTASPVLRRMDPDIELVRIYVPREQAEVAANAVEAWRRRGAQLRLFGD